MAESDSSITVGVRLRPLVQHEMGDRPCFTISGNTVSATARSRNAKQESWSFEVCMDSSDESNPNHVDNKQLFELMGQPLVRHVVGGFNTCIICYGQTGTGKTTSMMGDAERGPGLMPRFIDALFEEVQQMRRRGCSVEVSCQMFEVYNERIVDLLQEWRDPKHRVDARALPSGVIIAGAETKVVSSVEECTHWIEHGNSLRIVASTNMNPFSSRGHSVFKLTLKKSGGSDGVISNSEVYFADLAGHENERTTHVKGERFTELTFINSSLMWLQQCINSMKSSTGRATIEADETRSAGEMSKFRNSKLTMLLANAMRGNSKASVLITLSPAFAHHDTTMSSLKFAMGLKDVKILAVANSESDPQSVIAELEAEVKRLQEELAEVKNNKARSHPKASSPIEGAIMADSPHNGNSPRNGSPGPAFAFNLDNPRNTVARILAADAQELPAYCYNSELLPLAEKVNTISAALTRQLQNPRRVDGIARPAAKSASEPSSPSQQENGVLGSPGAATSSGALSPPQRNNHRIGALGQAITLENRLKQAVDQRRMPELKMAFQEASQIQGVMRSSDETIKHAAKEVRSMEHHVDARNAAAAEQRVSARLAAALEVAKNSTDASFRVPHLQQAFTQAAGAISMCRGAGLSRSATKLEKEVKSIMRAWQAAAWTSLRANLESKDVAALSASLLECVAAQLDSIPGSRESIEEARHLVCGANLETAIASGNASAIRSAIDIAGNCGLTERELHAAETKARAIERKILARWGLMAAWEFRKVIGAWNTSRNRLMQAFNEAKAVGLEECKYASVGVVISNFNQLAAVSFKIRRAMAEGTHEDLKDAIMDSQTLCRPPLTMGRTPSAALDDEEELPKDFASSLEILKQRMIQRAERMQEALEMLDAASHSKRKSVAIKELPLAIRNATGIAQPKDLDAASAAYHAAVAAKALEAAIQSRDVAKLTQAVGAGVEARLEGNHDYKLLLDEADLLLKLQKYRQDGNLKGLRQVANDWKANGFDGTVSAEIKEAIEKAKARAKENANPKRGYGARFR